VTDPLDANRLAAAKLWLTTPVAGPTGNFGNMPYLAAALYAMYAVACTEVATLAADERWTLYVNPSWLAAAPVPRIAEELVHAASHLLHDHASRARSLGVTQSGSRNWTLATDACIGELLITEAWSSGALPVPSSLGLASGASAEQHFAILHRLQVEDSAPGQEPLFSGDTPTGASATGSVSACGSGADGLQRSYELPSGAAGIDSVRSRAIREQVAIAFREHITNWGTVPGEWERWAQEILDPRIPWQQVLGAAVRRTAAWANGRTEYSYSRASRRQAAVRRVVLPGMRRPAPRVAVVVDTSGSVDDGLLGQALGEIDGTLQALGTPPEGVTVIACDADVHEVRRIRDVRAAVLAGGGGTDLRPGLVAAVSGRPRPDVVIALTDGYTPWPDHPLPVPLVAALIGRYGDPLPETPPWACRAECLI
jgi:predicted metal-dependent peptidase